MVIAASIDITDHSTFREFIRKSVTESDKDDIENPPAKKSSGEKASFYNKHSLVPLFRKTYEL